MDELYTELLDWSTQFDNYKLPRWDDLPEIGFYMDQVCEYIHTYVDIFNDSKVSNIITPSMINNYVKLGLMPPPIKKKYSKEHIANIMVITIIKQVTTISDIRDAMDMQLLTHKGRLSFNIFCDEVEDSIKQIHTTIKNKQLSVCRDIHIDTLAVTSISLSLSNKLIATKVVQLKKSKTDTE